MMTARDWLDMTWTEIAGAERARWIAVLPVAAVEQHGPHLPVGTDTHIARAYLARTLPLLPPSLPVSVLPLLAVGVSVEHAAFAGTLSLDAETFMRVIHDIGHSLHRAGIGKLVIINAHGGNTPALDAAALRLRAECGLLVVVTAWARFGYPDGLFGDAERRFGIHAGDIETSLMLAARPQAVRMAQARDTVSATQGMVEEFAWLSAHPPAGFAWMAQDLHPSGAVGRATAATREKGEVALAHGAAGFAALLQDVDRFDPRRLANVPQA